MSEVTFTGTEPVRPSSFAIGTAAQYGVFAPRGTPPAVLAKLNKTLNESLADEAVKTRMAVVEVVGRKSSDNSWRANTCAGMRARSRRHSAALAGGARAIQVEEPA